MFAGNRRNRAFPCGTECKDIVAAVFKLVLIDKMAGFYFVLVVLFAYPFILPLSYIFNGNRCLFSWLRCMLRYVLIFFVLQVCPQQPALDVTIAFF
jgi:hypothetical protein